jgi:hypothetical protein
MVTKIDPLKSVGPIHFGMNQTEVHSILGEPEFEGHPQEPGVYFESFLEKHVGVFYEDVDPKICIGVLIELPGEAIFDEHDLLGETIGKSLEFLRTRDPNLIVKEDVIYSSLLGIQYLGLGVSDSPKLPAYDGVIAFVPRYLELTSISSLPEMLGFTLMYIPKESLGPLRFGMSREEAHAAAQTLLEKPLSFNTRDNTAFARMVFPEQDWNGPRREYCPELALFLDYDPITQLLGQIQCFDNSFQVELLGQQLLNQPTDMLAAWLQNLDNNAEFSDSKRGYISQQYGLFLHPRSEIDVRRIDKVCFFSDSWPEDFIG